LAKSLPNSIKYTGVDLAENLIRSARNEDKNRLHKYYINDITKPLSLSEKIDRAVIILALQNVKDPNAVIRNASQSLMANGYFLVVLNHPMFRIPRQSSWGFDEQRKIQYRRVDKYMSPMDIPVKMNPSQWNSEETMSYHHSLHDYSKMLKDNGFVIELIEEWTSDKESQGKAKKMEDRARRGCRAADDERQRRGGATGGGVARRARGGGDHKRPFRGDHPPSRGPRRVLRLRSAFLDGRSYGADPRVR
jgi:SAM-dependent methyltransferase